MAFIYKKMTNEGYKFYIIFSRYLQHSYFSNSLPFPFSAMLFGHDSQTTWQNLEMDTEQFRNVQESERYDIMFPSLLIKIGIVSNDQP